MSNLHQRGNGFRKLVRMGMMFLSILVLGSVVGVIAGGVVFATLTHVSVPAAGATVPTRQISHGAVSEPVAPVVAVNPRESERATVPPPLQVPRAQAVDAVPVARAIPVEVADVPVRRAQPVTIAASQGFDARADVADDLSYAPRAQPVLSAYVPPDRVRLADRGTSRLDW